MIQKGDELINGVNRVNYQQYSTETNNFNYNNPQIINSNGYIMDNNSNNNGNLTQAMRLVYIFS